MSYSLNRRIDRRQNTRKRIAIKAYLSWSGQQPYRCWATDLSMNGAFIKVGSLRIPEGKIVKVVFVLAADSLIKMHYQSATVVHRSEQGLGLMFQ